MHFHNRNDHTDDGPGPDANAAGVLKSGFEGRNGHQLQGAITCATYIARQHFQ